MMQPKYNTYIGARYVPKIEGEWDNTRQYENLSIVTYQGASYTSKIWVPSGIDIENEEYWVCTGNYNAQVEIYRQEVKDVKRRVTVIEGKIDGYDSRIQDCTDRVTACEKKNVEQDAEIEEIKQKLDGGVTPITTEGLPIIGGICGVTQKFIRPATDTDPVSGSFPTLTTTNQGMCKTPDGFAFIKQQTENDNSTVLLEIKDDGTMKRVMFGALGHGNDCCYHDGFIYVTANLTTGTVLKRVNYTTFKIDESFNVNNWGGNVSFDPRTGWLIGFKRSDKEISFLGCDPEKKVLQVLDKNSSEHLNSVFSEYVDFHQGGVFYNGFYFVLGFKCLFVYDLRELNEINKGTIAEYNKLSFLGTISLPDESVEGMYMMEYEGIDVDSNGTFYITSSMYDNSVCYIASSRGTSNRKVNNATFFGMIDPFKAKETQTTDTLIVNHTKYVKSLPNTSDYDNAYFMDGSESHPFITLLVASYFKNPIARMNLTNYTAVPVFGDAFRTLDNSTVNTTFPSTSIALNGPLVIKDCRIAGSRTNYIRLSKGTPANSVIGGSLTLRRCYIDNVISVPNTSGFTNSDYPVGADGFATFTIQGSYANWDSNPRCYVSNSCGVGSNYTPVLGGYVGKGSMQNVSTQTSDAYIVIPKFEDTENACIVHLIDNAGNVVTGYPASPTILACSDGKRRTITRTTDGFSCTISETADFERIVFMPLNQV